MIQPPRAADWPPLGGPAALLAPALLDWASREDPGCPRLCLVTGARGAGESHLLAWLLAGSGSHPATIVHATVPARGHIAETLSWELGRQLGYGPLGPGDLVERLRADPRPARMIIPDLHLAGRGPADLPSATPRAVVTELLRPLLALPGVRAAVEVDRPELLADLFADPLPLAAPLILPLPPAGPPLPESVPSGVSPALGPAALAAPTAPVIGRDWRLASAEARETALDQALRDGIAPRLLADPGYLVHGSAVAITATLADRRIAAPARLRAAWAVAGPALGSGELADPERAAVLHAAALAADPRLAEYLRPVAEQHLWTARWSQPGLRTAGLALSERDLLVADLSGRLHAHDPADGSLVTRFATDPRRHPARIAATAAVGAIATVGGVGATGAEQVLAVDPGGQLHLLPLPAAAPAAPADPVDASASADAPAPAPTSAALRHLVERHNAAILTGAAARVTAVAADGGAAAVADADGWLHFWPLATPFAPVGSHQLHHRNPITAIACLALSHVRDGLHLVFTGAADGSVRLWDSASGCPMPEPVERRNALPTALAAAHTDAGPVLAVAWSDRRLHLWRLSEGRSTPVPLLQDVDTLALAPHGLLLCGGPQGTLALAVDPAAL